MTLIGANPVTTPCEEIRRLKEIEESQPPEASKAAEYRSLAARANYLASDRIDCQFAAKEVCRLMSKPTEGAWNALKRLCRYLAGLPRLVWKYDRQEVQMLDIYTDTDWAGCPRRRKSTSGGCVLLGSHSLKSWSSTQSSVAFN